MRTLIVSIIAVIFFANGLFAQTVAQDSIKAYVIVSLQGKAFEKTELLQNDVAGKIRNVIASEGIHISNDNETEAHDKSTLLINITLNDRIHIRASRPIEEGKDESSKIQFPSKSYKYKSIPDITSAVKQYVRNTIKANVATNKKIK
ncbi:MAG: hypothetical protein Q8933_09105 [Bacteroidota bacterium]|nr:hypothetical protein [Bacteroidota bacterium]MDP4194986.1 hypothetical protein [Bacteroidota bacterium]